MKKILSLSFLFFLSLFVLIGPGWAEEKKDYLVEISITRCCLALYEVVDGEKVLVKEYLVSTVKPSIKEHALGSGVVTGVEFNPVWHPTRLTRTEFQKRGIILPDVVPPGHPLNYMGMFKIHLSHSVPGKGDIYRIHGTRKEDEKLLGKRVSGGCIRMKNEDGLELSSLISVGDRVDIQM